jgi:hypothetical protein
VPRKFLITLDHEQITGLASAMLRRAVPVRTVEGSLDIVGTGGDGANTVNISTGSCILAAACGAKVAKVKTACTFKDRLLLYREMVSSLLFCRMRICKGTT